MNLKFQQNNLIKFFAISTSIWLMPAFAWVGGEQRENEREEAMHLAPDLENGKRIYELCAICHHETGWGDGADISQRQKPGYFPILAGQHRNVLIKQLADIRAGNRDNPMMYPYTLDKYIGGTQGIADVTAYIASLPGHPKNTVGPGNDLRLGQDLYRVHCEKCHGKYGEGSNEDFYPRLEGQHYDYMLRQFIWIRDGKRRNANYKMRRQIARFTFREMMAVIDYSSRLQPPGKEDSAKPTEEKK